jgi:serine/threonine protein kinase
MIHGHEHIEAKLGEYRLLGRLGNGSFGIVYLAEHIYEHTQVALKILQVPLTSRDAWKAFLNEARSFRLQHPHIIQLLDFGISKDDRPFLVMEYAPGGSVREQMVPQTPFLLPTVVSCTKQLASALQYAHDHRLIHRDVKPENTLMRADGTILLSDFGLASILDQSNSSGFTHSGTPAYMAPEQGMGHPCPASDQYSLAVMVYEWLTGRLPFIGFSMEVAIQHRLDPPPPPRAFNPAISSSLEQIILKALAKQPEARFPTVAQFAREIEEAVTAIEYEKIATQQLPPVSAVSLPIEQDAQQKEQSRQQAPSHIPVSAPLRGAFSGRRRLVLHSKKSLFLLSILLIAIVVFASTMILQKRPSQQHSISSTTPSASAQGTQSVRATATTPATSGLKPPAGWVQVLNDPMTASKHDSGWETNENCAFHTTYYEETSTGFSACTHGDASAAGTVYSDLFYSLDLSIQEGTEAGLLFRSTGGGFYAFSITTTGSYSLGTYQSANGAPTTFFASQLKPSSAIHQGLGQWNTLSVLARGTSFQFYINDIPVVTETDSTYAQGIICVAVNDLDTPSVYNNVWFKDASVWVP